MKTLRWQFDGPVAELEGKTEVGGVHYLDRNYVPLSVFIYCKTAPTTTLQIDIKDDGESLFDSTILPELIDADHQVHRFFSETRGEILEDSIISLDIKDSGDVSGSDLTVELNLDEA